MCVRFGLVGISLTNPHPQFDHKVFPGAIPRSLAGSIIVAWLSNYIARLANHFSLINSKFDLQIVSSYPPSVSLPLGQKEWRFVVYVVPMLNVAAAHGAQVVYAFFLSADRMDEVNSISKSAFASARGEFWVWSHF